MNDTEEGGLLNVTALVSMFEASEEASYESRKLAERDRDYHDGKQLSAEEEKALGKRGQPPYIDNRIKTKIDYLVGLEKQQRINPKAEPRTPVHEEDADAASQALNYVADAEDFDYKRSAVWRNLLVEGVGGIAVSVAQGYDGVDIKLSRIAWDRIFYDPHSSELDFSDAGYMGMVLWDDYDRALEKYPDAADALDATMASVTASDTYDDKPKYNLWADKKRRRVRIVQIWVKRGEDWFFAEFTKGGILKAGPSPYVDDKGASDCELFLQSSYVDRDNNRYGLVRELISPQDGINKTKSKALHLLNTAQIVVKEGLFSDVEKLRKEAARPDGVIIVPETGGPLMESFSFNTRTDLAAAHLGMLQEAQNSIDLKGPNATAMGDKAQGSAAASGKAIIASQQGGMVSLGDLLDNLRHLDKRVFRAIWNRIRQYWTGEKWIRVTDDERNLKWVVVNPGQESMQALQTNPQMGEKISGMIGNVADLDCDITIDEAPDSVVPALEQFEALVNLKQFDVNNELPFRALVMAAPNLKNRSQVLKEMDEAKEAAQQNPMAQMGQKLQLEGAQAEVADKQAAARLKEAQARKALSDAGANGPEGPTEIDLAKALADIRNINASTAKTVAETEKTQVETALAPAEFRRDQREAEMARQERFTMKRADLGAAADDRKSRENQFRRKASQAA